MKNKNDPAYPRFKVKDPNCLFHDFDKILPNPWHPKVNVWFLLILVASWFFWGTQAALCKEAVTQATHSFDATSTLSVTLKNGRLSIGAKQASWQELLKQIHYKTGIPIHCAIPLQGSVTVSFSELPVQEAVERLFGPGADFVFRYPKRTSPTLAAPQEVWVTGSFLGHDVQAIQATASKSKNTPKPQEAGRQDAKSIDDLLNKVQNEENAEERTQALASLSGQDKADEGAYKLALDAALSDKDASVREYAVQALANQPGQKAMEQMRQALQDKAPGVRIKAAESVVLNDQGLALLEEVRNTKDELLQAIVTDRIKQAKQ
jgi:HEAT repeats